MKQCPACGDTRTVWAIVVVTSYEVERTDWSGWDAVFRSGSIRQVVSCFGCDKLVADELVPMDRPAHPPMTAPPPGDTGAFDGWFTS